MSSKSLRRLRKDDVRKLIDAASKNDHFFSIKRYGEDFVARRQEPGGDSDDVPGAPPEAADISYDMLMND